MNPFRRWRDEPVSRAATEPPTGRCRASRAWLQPMLWQRPTNVWRRV